MPPGTPFEGIVRSGRPLAWRIAAGVAACALFSADAAAQIVLSGLSTSFSKTAFSDPTLRANQDRISLSVLVARGDVAGIYNAVLEDFFPPQDPATASPLLTEWASSLNNELGAMIAATNWQALEFDTWINAYGGLPGAGPSTVGTPAVLHIIPEDIYLDILFTDWAQTSAGGGAFSYQRSKTPDGDYNGNGVVDAADYTTWRDTVGLSAAAPGDGADGDLSGMIDQGDYEFWIEVFGEVTNTVDLPQGSATARDLPSGDATVPEPATLWLLLGGWLTARLFSHWRRSQRARAIR
jgi:hypothetical protein